jgi:hypothetical protein
MLIYSPQGVISTKARATHPFERPSETLLMTEVLEPIIYLDMMEWWESDHGVCRFKKVGSR